MTTVATLGQLCVAAEAEGVVPTLYRNKKHYALRVHVVDVDVDWENRVVRGVTVELRAVTPTDEDMKRAKVITPRRD